MKTQARKHHPSRGALVVIVFAISCSVALLGVQQVSAGGEPDEQEITKRIPSNHRMDEPSGAQSSESTTGTTSSARQSRQYDGSLSTSSTGNYAAMASDGGAYIGGGGGGGQLPMTGASYSATGSTGVGSSYMGDLSAGLGGYSTGAGYHDHMARGYPSMHSAGYPQGPPMPPPPPPPMSPLSAMFSSSNSMFPLMAKGFDVSEIICTAIAVAIGAVIVGAPFILLYLFVMNQMGGNGPAMGPNGGSISLTGPTSSTNVSGRRKRHTTFSEALFKQLSPFVNNEQLTNSFKMLIDSMAKYQA